MTKFIREFPVRLRTDRDCEMPVLEEFIKARAGKFKTLLDIGAHYSANTYAPIIRPFIKVYDGIDIKYDSRSARMLDYFIVGNANTWPLVKYDIVICVSVIEHAGISTYKANHVIEQMALFKRCIELAKKYVFISVDCGAPYFYPNEWSKITLKQWKEWEALVKSYKVKKRYFYTDWAQMGKPWKEHEDRKFAFSIPYKTKIGNQCIALMEIEK